MELWLLVIISLCVIVFLLNNEIERRFVKYMVKNTAKNFKNSVPLKLYKKEQRLSKKIKLFIDDEKNITITNGETLTSYSFIFDRSSKSGYMYFDDLVMYKYNNNDEANPVFRIIIYDRISYYNLED